jgi:NitT/TauT family transport system substrate-binding protein
MFSSHDRCCPESIPEQFENLESGLRMINNAVYVNMLRRTKDYGELQPDVWAAIQGPYVKLGEITKEIDPATSSVLTRNRANPALAAVAAPSE